MLLKDAKVGDLIRPVQAVEPWFATVVEIEPGVDPVTGEPVFFAVVEYEGNEYSLWGPPDQELEEHS